MRQIKTLIVDDEQHGRTTLRRFLEKYCPDLQIVSEAASVEEAELRIRCDTPQLIFLDINMPEENGFSLFGRIPAPAFHTIFVTAHEEHALRAIRHHALDYILKPVNITDLIRAVDHAKSVLDASTDKQVSTSMQMMQHPLQSEKIALPLLDGLIFKDAKDIVRCEAVGNYTSFHFTNSASILVCKNLGIYEVMLEPYGFARVHHHHLVNISHIEKYQRGRGGILLMSDNTEVVVSQRKKDEFLRRIDGSGILHETQIN